MKPGIASVFATLVLATATVAQADPIATEGGLVEGVTLESGVRAWLGIPFAAPPVRCTTSAPLSARCS
jgi:para-nitrobenzyl esterase